MRLIRSHKLFSVGVFFVALGLNATALAGATCEEQEVVEFKPIVQVFEVGKKTPVKAENTGNVEWKVAGENLEQGAAHKGIWSLKGFPECLPVSVKPGGTCEWPSELVCEAAGSITWILKVESAKKVTYEKNVELVCK